MVRNRLFGIEVTILLFLLTDPRGYHLFESSEQPDFIGRCHLRFVVRSSSKFTLKFTRKLKHGEGVNATSGFNSDPSIVMH